MSAYNFSVNPRLSLNPAPPPLTNTVSSTISGITTPVIRPPPPPPTPSPGHIMAVHHSLMGSTRPILISPQGFPVTANHQFFNERIFSPSAIAPVLSSGLNDAPLEFNVLRQKTIPNDQLMKDKLPSQATISFLENTEKQNVTNMVEVLDCNSQADKQHNEESEVLKNIIRIESDDDDCQVVSDMQSTNERISISSTKSSVSTVTSQNVPVLTTNSGIWNNLFPNMNFSMLGVNQMLTSNIIDPNLLVGQTFGVFGNVLSQIPNSGSAVEPDNNTSAKSIIHYKSCTLFPPNANAPAPTTRDRPQGCKTVFVGGLPENVKEEIIREVFGFCGDISNIRLSNKKFCHIRFVEETAVDRALSLSGYRIRLGSSSESCNTGRLHVDFAHARDDQFEWECKQRQMQREQRHKERLLRENCREISLSGPSHFTESEANSVLEKMKGEDTFLKAITIAVCWLDRGECNKRNVNCFYGMIQSVNSHVRRLLNDKTQCEAEFRKAKDLMKSKAQTILTQFTQIEKLFISSSHKKVWDHFTKAQRKNIEIWKKTAMEIKKLPIENDESVNDEMDVSDSDSDERSLYKKRKFDVLETNSLKDENDSLRCQLEAYKNEICVIRSELQCEINRKNEQINILQKTLNSLGQEIDRMKKAQPDPLCIEVSEKKAQEADTTVIPPVPSTNLFTENEAKLIGLISIFLHIHPFGAGVDYICSFLQKTVPSLKVTEIEQMMSKFPSVFQQEVVGIGANMERRWKYVGFNIESDTSVMQV